MYFWRIEKLKDELAKHPLRQEQLFAYYLGSTLLLFFADYPVDREIILISDEWRVWFIYVIETLIFLLASYFINGGKKGRDFIGRFLSIKFVVDIRYFVFSFSLSFLLMIIEGYNTYSYSQKDQILTIVLAVVYTYKSITHFKDVNRLQDSDNG